MGFVIVRVLVFAALISLVLGCTGPEKNKIIGILRDVDWKELAEQLNLNCATSIHAACQNELDPISCKLRGVLTRLIDSRDPKTCCKIAEEVASALRSLANPRTMVASVLVNDMCAPSESIASNPDERRNGEPINLESNPESNQVLLALSLVIALGLLTAFIFKATQSSHNREGFGLIQDHSGNRGGEDTLIVSGGWMMLLFRNKILVIVVLLLCSSVLLYYHWMTESATQSTGNREGFGSIQDDSGNRGGEEIPKIDFHLDTKKGVLILVTSTYNGTLPLTVKDRNEMITTFTQLDYYIAELHDNDANRSNVLKLLQQLSDYLSRYSGPLLGRALVFGFSGHGNSGTIQLDDRISIMDDIVKYYVQHHKVFDIPKIFFIDACRGGEVMTKSLPQIVSKYEATKGRVHEEGNFLIAYATIDKHAAYDGNWMHKLAIKIKSNLNLSLTTILQNLNGKLTRYQQAEVVTRLRKDFAFGM